MTVSEKESKNIMLGDIEAEVNQIMKDVNADFSECVSFKIICAKESRDVNESMDKILFDLSKD